MNLASEIKVRLDSLYSFVEVANGVRFNTHCLYPNNGFVKVVVLGAGNSFFVSDEGGAVRESEIAGASLDNPDRMFAKTLKAQGLQMHHAAIISQQVSLDDLPAAIALVANASKEIAESIFDEWRLARNRNFKEMLRRFLKIEFSDKSVQEQSIVGTSTKAHSFDTVVQFLDGSRLLVDAVLRDVKSINSRVVANLDVKQANHPQLSQSIVYDDEEDWNLTDLNLLHVSNVPIIPFSKSQVALRQFVRI